jgi:hypothetical protein
MTDSPLSFALDSVSMAARRQPIVLVGGSFRIPAIREKIRHRLEKGGALEGNLLFPDNPESLSVQGMVQLFINRKPQLKVIGNANTDPQETELQRSAEIGESDQDSGGATRNGAVLLDTQSA